MIRIDCPLCESKICMPYAIIDHRNIVMCKKCGFVYAMEYNEDELNRLYLESYYASAKDPRIQEWINRFQKTWQGLVEDLLNAKSSVDKLIDIGAGTGGFLLSFHQSSPQTKIFAVESSSQAREHLLSKLETLQFPVNSAEELHLINETYDVVVLLQCLEHVNNPLLLCKQIFRILKENGVLLLTVPNRISIDVFFKNKSATRCYGNQTHLQFFSNDTMVAMLKKAGFANIRRISRYGGSEASNLKGILQFVLRKLGLSSELRYIITKTKP